MESKSRSPGISSGS
uniref:Uncharacterized protein n=1 Tax=Anguilla anguilla TaxID=7936 RepID=A0A0E9VDY7_ANGAN